MNDLVVQGLHQGLDVVFDGEPRVDDALCDLDDDLHVVGCAVRADEATDKVSGLGVDHVPNLQRNLGGDDRGQACAKLRVHLLVESLLLWGVVARRDGLGLDLPDRLSGCRNFR